MIKLLTKPSTTGYFFLPSGEKCDEKCPCPLKTDLIFASMKRTILQHRRNSATPRPNFTREFEQWLGRALTPAEKNTFDVLEWVRRYRRDTILRMMHVSGHKTQKTFMDYIKLSSEEIADEIASMSKKENDMW